MMSLVVDLWNLRCLKTGSWIWSAVYETGIPGDVNGDVPAEGEGEKGQDGAWGASAFNKEPKKMKKESQGGRNKRKAESRKPRV